MNVAILICAVGFFFMENNYFGWNALPKSSAELICDGLVLVLFSLSFLDH